MIGIFLQHPVFSLIVGDILLDRVFRADLRNYVVCWDV